jgi:hypothetical protein
LGPWDLELGIYLGFGACDLGFSILAFLFFLPSTVSRLP